MKTKSTQVPEIQPRFRVRVGHEVALGPGKIELLKWVQQTGSITEAARHMRMSYMRAWTLIQTMNRCFKESLVVASRGGRKGGGAKITRVGCRALSLYQGMERDSLRVCEGARRKLQQLLKA